MNKIYFIEIINISLKLLLFLISRTFHTFFSLRRPRDKFIGTNADEKMKKYNHIIHLRKGTKETCKINIELNLET